MAVIIQFVLDLNPGYRSSITVFIKYQLKSHHSLLKKKEVFRKTKNNFRKMNVRILTIFGKEITIQDEELKLPKHFKIKGVEREPSW